MQKFNIDSLSDYIAEMEYKIKKSRKDVFYCAFCNTSKKLSEMVWETSKNEICLECKNILDKINPVK